MEKELKNVYEHYRKHYINDQITTRIQNKVHQEIENDNMSQFKKQRPGFVKKLSYASAFCVVVIGLFIGSAFFSPAMAEVASIIPFLSKIFEQKPISEMVRDSLMDKGYKVSGVGYSVHGKIFHVTVDGPEDYYNQVNGEIKKITEEVIASSGYDDFKVEVGQERRIEHKDDPRNRDVELVLDVVNEIVPKLQQQGYKIHTYGSGYPGPDAKMISVHLDIEDTEKRSDDIERAILEGIQKLDIKKEVTVKFYKFNVLKREIENKWASKVLPVIGEGLLGKKEYKTKGFGYSYKKGIMNIYISTKIEKSDSEAPELASKIETEIREFLQSEDLKDIVADTPYKIIVRDKGGKDIN
ncbi:hypothetical protein DRW41_11355 [Neobacillus piezotolerans]|uniref:DUF4030 domain-containing protein n=1 Tax=Neobacillus piezotolerans TaxID=2259171 RepID=A0A3D8GR27_9BACI|nr:DUF4030 domain-containing protein [Neobacillus piezotolerans]RDU36649.1 hypothetical protein DRW41_11355 [Neobacillus piezotolerans]